jgi:AcrR family transcriptional regulator
MASVFDPRASASQLRPGRSTLPRGHVTEIQRNRMLAAGVDAVAEVGYARMTVAQVIGRARVSRKTFYDVFSDREDCFLAVLDGAIGRAERAIGDAYAGESGWRDGIRAGLAALLALMDAEPALSRLCIVESLAAGDRVLARRAAVLSGLATVVDEGRNGSRSAHEPPELTAQGVVGAVFTVLHTRLLEGGEEPFSDLLGALMSMIVLPYLGSRAAGRELALSSSARQRPRRPPADRPADPLRGINMRLTYRTLRVLTVIAEHAGASNREIAERSGITDQGQISKLLTRLARLELIVNVGGGQERGASNAWHLTTRGTQVERAARPH